MYSLSASKTISMLRCGIIQIGIKNVRVFLKILGQGGEVFNDEEVCTMKRAP